MIEKKTHRFNLFLDEPLYWRLKNYTLKQEIMQQDRLSMADVIREAVVALLDFKKA